MSTTTTSPALVTVGYEGRSAHELVELLSAARVSVVVDVRLTPLSRKPGLSKRALSELLAGSGIGYVHVRGLGNPKDNRDGFRRRDAASWQRFRDVLSGGEGREGLDRVQQLISDGHTVALLCFEHDHSTCHRSVVAEALVHADPATGIAQL